MDDIDIDIEDLEAMLYSQVYHGSADDPVIPVNSGPSASSSDNVLRHVDTYRLSNMGDGRDGRMYSNRYFDRNGLNATVDGNNGHGEKVLINYPHPTVKQPQTVMNLQNPNNFGRNLNTHPHSVALQPVYMNPVNNIVLIPPPPTQIITSQQPPSNKTIKKLIRKENKKRYKLKKKQARLLKIIREKDKQQKVSSGFIIHKSNTRRHSPIIFHDSGSDVEILSVPEEIISISDDEQMNKSSVLLVSSDEDKGRKEKTSYINVANEEEERKQKFVNNISITGSDDDVLYVEPDPKLNEIIILDTDESITTKQQADTEVLKSDNTAHKKKVNPNIVTSKERKELLNTPESTASNDFLEHSGMEVQQNNFNFGLHGADFVPSTSSKFLRPKTPADPTEIYETESSCSTSDIVTPVKNIVFNETEFESPKDLFSDNNLEHFGMYITPRRDACSNIPTILTQTNNDNSDIVHTKASKILAKRRITNESDSSSESEYEFSKLGTKNPIKKLKKNCNLPCLSPIHVSDDDNKNSEKSKSSKKKTKPKSASDIEELEKSKSKKRRKKTVSNSEKTTKLIEDVENVDDGLKNKRKSDQTEKNLIPDSSPPKKKAKVRKNKNSCEEISREELNLNEDTVKKRPKSLASENIIDISDQSSSSDESIYLLPELEKLSTDIELANCIEKKQTTVKEGKKRNPNEPKRFKDYWTTDMQKFYTQSWGLENFNVKKAQAIMSDKPEFWKILDLDRIYINMQTPRGTKCHRCRQVGHYSNQCPNKPGPPKCSLCGHSGHYEPRCPNKLCTQCGKKGKYTTVFCNYCAVDRNYRCSICHMMGHIEDYCPDTWRRYHNTISECRPEPQRGTQLIPHKSRWCSGCASNGHLEYVCRYYNRTHPPVDPCVRSYRDIYGFRRAGQQCNETSTASSSAKTEIPSQGKLKQVCATAVNDSASQFKSEPIHNSAKTTDNLKVIDVIECPDDLQDLTVSPERPGESNAEREEIRSNIFISLNNNGSEQNETHGNVQRQVYMQPQIPSSVNLQNQVYYPQNPIVFQLPSVSSFIPLVNQNVITTGSNLQYLNSNYTLSNSNPNFIINEPPRGMPQESPLNFVNISYIHAKFLLEDVPGIDFIHDLECETNVRIKIFLNHNRRGPIVVFEGGKVDSKTCKHQLKYFIQLDMEYLFVPSKSDRFIRFLNDCLKGPSKDQVVKAMNRLRSFESELKQTTITFRRLYFKSMIREQILILNRCVQFLKGDAQKHLCFLNSFIEECRSLDAFEIPQSKLALLKEAFYSIFYKRRTVQEYSSYSRKKCK